MGKIPNPLNPPDDTESLTDHVLYEWSVLGKHQDAVHAWACSGDIDPEGLWERVHYLLEVLDNLHDLHPDIRLWRSISLMTLNCMHGGGVPKTLSRTSK
jgi:hypothetical protein